MAADEAGDKSEAPTPRRRQEARDQGNVVRSADLSSAVLLLGMLMLLNWFGKGVVEALKSTMDHMLGHQSLSDFSATAASQAATQTIIQIGGAMTPLLGGAVLVIVAINVAQVGFNLNSNRLQPKLSALSPIKGLGKIFNKKSMVAMLINVLKLVLVGWVAWTAVAGRMGEIIAAQNLDFLPIFYLGATLVYSIGIRIGIVLLILALIDYAWQKWKTEQELKMTKQEVKEEMKRMEGDPKIKQRRKQIAMQMLNQRLKSDVPKADVVVTNPTHYAVALKYDAGNMHAPRVVAKGQDYIALRIREIAVECGIPVVERPPLARALFSTVEVGQEIPGNLYAAVAEILAYVYELTGKTKRKQPVPA